jgi:hypothetical protein
MPDAISTPNVRTFQVTPDLPQPLAPLLELSKNLWWVWNTDAGEIFRRLDRKLWEEVRHNPVKLLGTIDQGKLRGPGKPRVVQDHARGPGQDAGGVFLGRVWHARIAADLFGRPGRAGRAIISKAPARSGCRWWRWGCCIATDISSNI